MALSREKKILVSFRLTTLLMKNLKAFSVQSDSTQNAIVEKALIKFLSANGVNVNQSPCITWDDPPSGQS